MPPVLGTRVAVADRLVVLSRGQRQRGNPVDQGEETGLFAIEKLLDDDFMPGCTEASGEDLVDCYHRFSHRLCDCDALAGSQSIRFDHDRSTVIFHVSSRRIGIGESAERASRDVVFRTNIFGETLRSLEGRGFGAGAERFDPSLRQAIDKALDKRLFRADDHVVHSLASAESDETVDICRADVDAGRDLADAAVARGTIKGVGQGRGADRPAQRVLATTRANDEYVQLSPLMYLANTNRANM